MKKFLSILIALSLIISMLPMAFADGETAGDPVKVTYTLTHADGETGTIPLARSENSSTKTDKHSIERLIGVKTRYLHSSYFDYAGKGWKILDVTDDIVEAGVNFGSYLRIYEDGYLQLKLTASTTYSPSLGIAFALEAPAISGFYVPDILYTTSSFYAPDTGVEFASRLIENKTKLDNYTGLENKVETTSNSGQTTFNGAIYSSSDDEVVIAVTNTTVKDYHFKSITLTPIVGPTMTTTVNGFDVLSLDLTDTDTTNDTATASTKVSGKKNGTTSITMPVSNNFITYKSSDEAVATVADDGTITATGGGTAEVWAETPDGAVSSAPITVTVTATEDEEPEEVPSGVTVVYDISGVMDKMAQDNGGTSGDGSFGGKGYWGLDYTASDGFWEYAANRTDGHYSWNSDGINCAYGISGNTASMRFRRTLYSGRNGLQIKNASNWWAIKINVPVSGIYTPKVTYWYFTNTGDAGINYFLIKDTGEKLDTILSENAFTADSEDFIGAKQSSGYAKDGYAFDEAFDEDKYLEAGEYYLVYKPYIDGSDGYPVASNFTLDGGEGSVPMINMSISADEIIKESTATVSAEVKKMSKPEIDLTTKLDNRTQQPYTFADADADNITIAYSIAEEDKEIASITEAGVITGLSEGIATVVATATQNGKIVSTATKKISVVTPPVLDKEITYAEKTHTGGDANVFTFKAFSTDGESLNVEFDESTNITLGKKTTVSTDDTITVGDVTYNFLYWAKGATMAKKQIVSFEEKFDYLPGEGSNFLIAVYEPETAGDETKVEFYNGNGQLLPDVTLTDGKYLPDYPSMAGYGTAYGWGLKVGDDYVEYKAGDDVSELSGNLMFAAMYEELKADITVFVDGTARIVKYGDKVTCTPDSSKGTLMYWMKDGSVVSLEDTYSFLAWEDCRVEAVYGTNKPVLSAGFEMRKIVLDRFAAGNETAIMAEFIGFDDAVEKGIMFGNQKIAMSSKSSQFTVLDDTTDADTAYGYAIIPDGTGYKLLKDGIVHIGANNEETILEGRRDAAESYMRKMTSVLWSPAEDLTYTVGSDDSYTFELKADRTYQGIPYAYTTGSYETFAEFAEDSDNDNIYEVSGLTADALTGGSGISRIGNDCSGSVVRAWSVFGAKVQAKATRYMNEKYGFLKVGDYELLESDYDYKNRGTNAIVEANGREKMFAAYAELQKADAVVHYDEGGWGHTMMVVSVDEEAQTVTIHEQTKRYYKDNATTTVNGETVYKICGVDEVFTFQDLYDDGYLPITCRELREANYIADKATFRDTLAEESHNLRNIFRGTIHSTKAIDTVKVEILSGGTVVQNAIASVARANIFAFNMQQFVTDNPAAIRGKGIDTDSLASGTYTCNVTVYLTADTEGTTVRKFTFTK